MNCFVPFTNDLIGALHVIKHILNLNILIYFTILNINSLDLIIKKSTMLINNKILECLLVMLLAKWNVDYCPGFVSRKNKSYFKDD